MRTLIRTLGGMLVFAGMALLAYIGLTYAHSVGGPDASSRTGLNSRQGVASGLVRHQNVAVPKYRVSVGTGNAAVRMVIPRIGVDSRVVQSAPAGGIWAVADWAVGHLSTTPGPGVPGNGAYAAHDDIKGEIFKRIGELAPGDVIELYTQHRVYRYSVSGQAIVDPSDVAVLAPTRKPTVTLVTCSPYWVDTNRLIVKAVLKSSAPA